jgi:predicted transcriptional regulator
MCATCWGRWSMACTPEQLRQDTLAAWAEYQETGLHVTEQEMDDWLAKLEAGEDAPPPTCHRDD